MVVYPEGIWYSGVRGKDVPEIVMEHFQNERPVERLVNRNAAALKQEITGSRHRRVAGLRAREAAGVVSDESTPDRDGAGPVHGYRTCT